MSDDEDDVVTKAVKAAKVMARSVKTWDWRNLLTAAYLGITSRTDRLPYLNAARYGVMDMLRKEGEGRQGVNGGRVPKGQTFQMSVLDDFGFTPVDAEDSGCSGTADHDMLHGWCETRWMRRGLPWRCRIATYLYAVEDMTMREVGQALGCSESRVSMLVQEFKDDVTDNISDPDAEDKYMADRFALTLNATAVLDELPPPPPLPGPGPAGLQAMLDRIKSVWFAGRKEYSRAMVEVGGLIHEYVLARLKVGDGMSESHRRVAGAVRQKATADAAEAMTCTVYRVNEVIRAWAIVNLLSEDGTTGRMPYAAIRVFRNAVERTRGGLRRCKKVADGVEASSLEEWRVIDERAVAVFRRGAAGGWSASRATRELANLDDPEGLLVMVEPEARPVQVSMSSPTSFNPEASMGDDKPLTTGQISKMLHVATRTVSKMIDSGKLKAYRLPGSLDRRVLPADLVTMLNANGMPIPGGLQPDQVLTFGLRTDEVPTSGTTCSVTCPIELGLAIANMKVGIAVVSDAVGHSLGLKACEMIVRQHPTARVAYVMPDDLVTDPPEVDVVVNRPVTSEWLASLIMDLKTQRRSS